MEEFKLRKALFVSLDETLITTKSGNKHPVHRKDWKFNLEVLDAIDYFYKNGYIIIIVSNQIGIQYGFTIEQVFTAKIEEICQIIEKDLKIKDRDVIYSYCSKDNDYNTMPNPGQAFECAIDYELDLKESIMVGNCNRDKKFAEKSGITTYYTLNNLIDINYSE